MLYPSLDNELRIGDHYLRLLFEKEGDSAADMLHALDLRDPQGFFNSLYMRMLRGGCVWEWVCVWVWVCARAPCPPDSAPRAHTLTRSHARTLTRTHARAPQSATRSCGCTACAR